MKKLNLYIVVSCMIIGIFLLLKTVLPDTPVFSTFHTVVELLFTFIYVVVICFIAQDVRKFLTKELKKENNDK